MQAQAKQTIAENVLKNTLLLIEALKDNYRQYAIRGHQRSAERGESVEYHLRCIDELKSGFCPIEYEIETGKKYLPFVMLLTISPLSLIATISFSSIKTLIILPLSNIFCVFQVLPSSWLTFITP